MRYLTREHWKSFEKPDGRFDGIKFEELVSTLLPSLYPGEWVPTQYSWDGKKDFYQQSGAERRWAECKAYKESISINVISPTLVMALLEDAHVIILFSYSRINKNARWYLPQFASLTSRTILYYDDETLEDLILAHADIPTFFPTISATSLFSPRDITASARLSQDPDIEYHVGDMMEQDNKDIYLSLLSTFSVDVLVRNENAVSPPVSGRICLDPNDLVNNFWLFNRDISSENLYVPFTLQPGESFFYRFYFRARRSGRLVAPRVTVDVDGKPPRLLDLEGIEVSSVLAVPLVGAPQHAALVSFKQSVSARDKPVFFYLHGKSGTGKSRLLREFRDELLGRGYSVFTFNGEDARNSSFDYFVKRLASTICKLPMLDNIVRPSEADTGFTMAQSGQKLLDLLYCDNSSPSQNRELSIQTILSILSTRKAAIVIDNMQFLDADTISLINTAINETRDTAARNVWLLGLNTEVITSEMPAANLSARLKTLAAEESTSVVSIEVEEFTEEDARLYLDYALAGISSDDGEEAFTTTHPQTAGLIINRVGTRPLFLEQALQYAADRGGLGLSSGSLYIKDIEQFHAAINSLPRRIQELIAKRWDFIRPYLQASAVLLVRSLAELISMPMPIVSKLGVTRNDIDTLANLGIIDITESNEIRFHHAQHYLFFVDFYSHIKPSFARRLLDAISDAGYSGAYPFQDIILRETIGQLLDEDLQRIAAIIIENSVAGAARQRATPFLLEIFNRPNIGVDPNTELQVVTALCQELKHYESYETSTKAYNNARDIRVLRKARYLDYGEAYYEFVRSHANSFFALRRDADALQLLQSSLNDLVRFKFKTEDRRLLARGKLLNRLCVALRSVNDRKSAEESVRESLMIAESLSNTPLTYKNYVDWGYIYHGFSKHNNKLIEKWSAALKIFHENDEMDSALQSERASHFHHDAALKILNRRQSEAVEIIEEGIRYNQRILSPFHEVKLLLLRVIAELAWGGETDPKSLRDWINMAEDRAVRAQVMRSYWIVFYLRAKLYWRGNEFGKAMENFLVALQQIEKILIDPRMELRHETFFEDLALHMRLAQQIMPEKEMRLIKSVHIRRKMEFILNMPSSDFDNWLLNYEPTATYHDGRYNLPVP